MDFRTMVPFGRRDLAERGLSGRDDPFQAMRREMDRLFEGFARDWPGLMRGDADSVRLPKVDIAETDAGLEMTAELPGFAEKDISLDIADNVLTLKAEHSEEKETQDEAKNWHVTERSHGSVMRRFELPFEADEEKITATYDKGVLTVTVPRAAGSERPSRKIEVKGAPTTS